MPKIYCRKCGTLARSTDLYCRKCGTSLGSNVVPEGSPLLAQPEPRKEGIPSPGSPISRRTACLAAAGGLLLAAFLLVAVLFIFLPKQPGGMPAITIKIADTATLYPTRKPYPTASPYRTATPYPTAVTYPTTGVLATVASIASASTPPFAFTVPTFTFPKNNFNNNCELIVKNQYTVDSIVVLADVNTNAVVAAVYVRANDSFSTSGISTGTYYIFYELGQDWDGLAGRFTNYARYSRFKDPNVFDTCSSYLFHGYGSLTVILNFTEGSGLDTINVQPDSFPGFSH